MINKQCILLLLLLPGAACTSGPELDSEEITPEDLAASAKKKNHQTDAELLGRFESRSRLFTTLDQNLRSWRALSASGNLVKQYQLQSLEEAMTRTVYLNFDMILDELQQGDPDYRPIAAAALGFSVIIDPDEPGGDPNYPQVHERAVLPLVAALEEGNDALTQNALLSLSLIASPSTPIELILEMLVMHHEANVRANAGLVLAKVLQPYHAGIALSSLYAALGDESAKVRLHVVSCLGALGDGNSSPQLIDVLTSDDSALVSANAARTLGRLESRAAVPFLIGGLRSPSLRHECRRALIEITKEDLGADPDEWRDWVQDNPGF